MADPIHQFEIQKLATLGHIGGHEIAFTNSALFMAITVVGIWALLVGGSSAKSLIPGRMQSIAELSYEFVANTIQIGRHYRNEIATVLVAVSLTQFNTCYLGNSIRLIGGLQSSG